MRTAIHSLIWTLACCAGSLQALSAEEVWEPVPVGTGESAVVAVAVDPGAPARVVAASPRTVYESRDGGRAWVRRFQAPAGTTVTDVASGSPAGRPAILVATNQGLYGSLASDTEWQQLFRGSGEGERHSILAAFHPDQSGRIVLGTRGGLFISPDGRRQWREVALPRAAREILDFAFDPKDPERLYVVTTAGAFTGSIAGGGWRQLARTLVAEELEVEEPEGLAASETDEEHGSLHRLSAIAVDPGNPAVLYLAGARGLLQSLDGGMTWNPVDRTGLASRGISRLLLQAHSPLVVYAATKQGVARYEPGHTRWTMLIQGLAATRIHDLAASKNQLWAATANGLYRYEVPPDAFGQEEPPSPRELLANFSYEPTIAQVREAAIRYAEVHPDKIRWWRRQAALQALLPAVNFGMDRDRSRDVHVDEGSFPNFQLLQTEDHDAGVDVTVTWDLGELIWNDDQTSIDVRSKLMVQLRDDIVDEVTRTYFERRRLQVALLTSPPTGEQGLLDKELRLQELTALLDGLTGGYFSRQVTVPRNQ